MSWFSVFLVTYLIVSFDLNLFDRFSPSYLWFRVLGFVFRFLLFLVTFMTVARIAMLTSVLSGRFKLVTVFLAGEGGEIVGKLLANEDSFIRVLDSNGDVIEVNQSYIKMIVRDGG